MLSAILQKILCYVKTFFGLGCGKQKYAREKESFDNEPLNGKIFIKSLYVKQIFPLYLSAAYYICLIANQ